MTVLTRPISRKTAMVLDGCFGPDRGKAIIVRLIPGDGKGIADLIELRPERTRRAERITVSDVYRFALRCRINRELLEKARARKERIAQLRAQRQLDAAERRLRQRAREEAA
jgi:hypothetical protein